MDVMKQGNKYEEQNEETEVMEETPPKVPKKLILLGAGIVGVGLVILLLVQALGGNDKAVDPESVATDDTVFTDIDGNPISEEDLFPTTTFTAEEIESLRNSGYTGDEIEAAQANGRDSASMLQEARAGQEEALRKMYVELSDKAKDPKSKEFKQLISLTWLGGKPVTLSAEDPDIYMATSLKENCRYVKIPARGKQLFIKLELESDGQSVFYNVTPQRYHQLKNEGNMVITYDLVDFGEGKFVTNIQEVSI